MTAEETMDAIDQATLGALRRQALHGVGEVLADDGDGRLRVRTDGELGAGLALSCLVRPEVGDRVLVSGTLPENLYVIAVLERPGDAPLQLDLARETEVTVAGGGGLGLRSGGPLRIGSGARVEVDAPELMLRAGQATLACRRMTAVARDVLATLRNCRLVAGLVETSADSVHLRAARSQREVRDLELVRAGNLDYRADQALQLRAQDLLGTAQRLVKLDGDQIHLG
jgi:hypothetical protein